MVNLGESLVEQIKHRMEYVKEHQGELKPWIVSVSAKKEDGFLIYFQTGKGFKFDSLEIKVEGNVSPQKPVRFTDITYEGIFEAEKMITNTLKRSCHVEGLVFHNGNKIDEHHDG